MPAKKIKKPGPVPKRKTPRITADPASMSVIRYTPVRPFVLHLNHTGAQLASALTAPPAPTTDGKTDDDAVVGGSTD